MHRIQMFVLFPVLALVVPISSAEDLETPLNDKETFETINSMYTNDLVWSDEWAKKALDWLKSPEYRESVDADLIVGGRSLIANANDKAVWQKILDVLEIQFDEAEAEVKNVITECYPKATLPFVRQGCQKLKSCVQLERLPPGTVYGCNGYMSTRETNYDYVSAVCLYKKQ